MADGSGEGDAAGQAWPPTRRSLYAALMNGQVGVVVGIVVWLAFFIATMALLTTTFIADEEDLAIAVVTNVALVVAVVLLYTCAQARFLESGPLRCEICGATFTSRQLLKSHSRAVHLARSVRTA